MTDTVLVLSGMGVVPYSTRAATQTLEPISQASANVYRDVNGVLRSLDGTSFQKYRSTITCTDQRPFAVDGVWPGKVVTVSCIQTLAYPAEGTPQRPTSTGGEFTEGDWVFYYPVLDMMVVGFSVQTDEWGATVSWRMDLEEV